MSAVVFILLIGAAQSAAQPEVTLEQCQSWSQALNAGVLRAEMERSLDRPARMAAWGQFLPSVSVGYSMDQSAFYNPTYLNPDGSISTFPRTHPGYDTYVDDNGFVRVDTTSYRTEVEPVPEGRRRSSNSFVRVNETLFDGGRNYFNLKNSALAQQTREAQISDVRRLARGAVTRAYCNAVAATRQLDLAGRMVSQRRMLLELARARLAAGSVTERDVLQAEVELGRARSDSLGAALASRRAAEELNIQIGLPLDTALTLAALPPPFSPLWAIERLESDAVTARSDVTAVRKSADQFANESKAARGDYLPRLTAGVSQDRTERSGAAEPFTLNPRNRVTSVDLTLSWLLFDRFTRSLKLQEARLRQGQAQIDIINLESEIRRQVRAAAERLQAAFWQVQVAADNALLAERTLEFERERYRLGSATLIDLNSAQLSFHQAETERIRLESEFGTALGDLEAAVGKPLEKSESGKVGK